MVRAVFPTARLGVLAKPTVPDDPDEPENPILTGTAPQYIMWDGITGPNQDLFNGGCKIYWKNRGVGDWKDSNGTEQGAAYYTRTQVTGAGAFNWTVTALVQKWINQGQPNKGFFLKGSGTPFYYNFGGRTNATVASRPKLTIVTSTGTFTRNAIANPYWAIASYTHRDSAAVFRVQEGSNHAIVQFDLSGVTGTVSSATMTLTCTTFNRVGYIEIYEGNQPGYSNGGTGALKGIAQNYTRDQGIWNHAAVMGYTDFITGDKASHPWMTLGTPREMVTDPFLNTPSARKVMLAGEYEVGTAKVQLMTAAVADGPPTTVVDEAYGRYYLTLEPDWTSPVDTNKCPGFDMRMGFWVRNGNVNGGYWQQTGGNSGARHDGRYLPVQWGSTTKMSYRGHMQRGHSGKAPVDANPYRGMTWLGTYMYHIDQADQYGDLFRWGNVLMERGKPYCIEQHVKMNSITGPVLDQYGNREAVADGVYEAWVDGTLFYRKTNMRWRRHPHLGVSSFWMGMYHGGKIATDRTMHCQWSNVVVARQYIGPMGGVSARPGRE